MKEAFFKVMDNLPVIFIATFVSLLATTLYNIERINLLSYEGFALVGEIFLIVMFSLGLIILVMFGLLLIIHYFKK